MSLPTDYDARKAIPLASVLDYFPDALAAIAAVIGAGQAQHGTTGWDRAKSRDEESTLIRHFLERGTLDTDGVRHSAKMAWRALALLQKEIEAATGAEISRGSYDSSKGQTRPGDPYPSTDPETLSDGRSAREVARELLTHPNPGYSPRAG